jgi:hypothetical protein
MTEHDEDSGSTRSPTLSSEDLRQEELSSLQLRINEPRRTPSRGRCLFRAVGRTWPRRRTFLTSYVVSAGIIYATLALSPPLAVAIIAAIAAGLAFGPVNPIFATVTSVMIGLVDRPERKMSDIT